MNKYQEAIEVVDTLLHLMCGEEREDGYKPTMEEMSKSMDLLTDLANKADSFEWIPFEMEDGFLYCQIPNVDEDILVSDGYSVWEDAWREADEGYGLESGIYLKNLAWMPLPNPYKEKENERKRNV